MRGMLKPGSFTKDWGIWGWIWALGWFGFVLGILLAPEVLRGHTSFLVLLMPAMGGLLMFASSRKALVSQA
ncbi:MAG: hypothetical protein ACE5HJ_07830 [Thermoplasmata archaeon]